MSLSLEIAFICSKSLSRTVPYNYIALGVFTFTMSMWLGQCLSICVVSKNALGEYIINSEVQNIIVLAAFLTAATAISLTIYAYLQTEKITITGSIFSLLICQLICFFFSIFIFDFIGFFYILICVLSAVVAGLYFVYHTMLIRGAFNI